MKLIGSAIGIAALFTIGLAAQTETTTKQKVDVKDGHEITTSGCVERTRGGNFVLTGATGGAIQYVLVGKDDVSKHVGERVEVRGKATDLGDAKVKVESKTKTETDGRADRESRTTTEHSGDVPGAPLLGVKSIKKLASSCS